MVADEPPPPEVARPRTVDALAHVLASTSGVVAVRGGGTKQTWGASGAPPELVIDMTAMNAIVEHAEGDLVVTAQSGVRLADLQVALAPAGQWLALDPPEPGATLGGVVATAASGPRRLRFGTARDLLIGITVILADGTIARSGGKVVKNVAGYDLGKLFTGSFGTLGVIAECTFRLHPVALARRVVSVSTTDPAPLVRHLLRSPVVPSAVEWDGATLHIVVESTELGAQRQAADVAGLVRGAVQAGETQVADLRAGELLPVGFGDRPWAAGDVALKVTHRLSALGRVLAAIAELCPGARVNAQAGSGVVHVGWSAPPDQVAPGLVRLRACVAVADGHVVVVDAPEEVKRTVDVWGPTPGLAVMRRIKERFDPQQRMQPGRYVGGI